MDPSPGEEEDRDHSPNRADMMDRSPCSVKPYGPQSYRGRRRFHLSDDNVRRGQATDCRH